MGKDKPEVPRISRLISDLASIQGWSAKLARARIWDVWEEVVGAEIDRHAWPVRLIKGEVLEVAVSDSVWMQQLSFHKAIMVQDLNKRLPGEAAIKDIRLVLGDPGKRPSRNKKIGSHVINKDLKMDQNELDLAEKRFGGIQDEQLRQALLRVYVKSRQRQKND